MLIYYNFLNLSLQNLADFLGINQKDMMKNSILERVISFIYNPNLINKLKFHFKINVKAPFYSKRIIPYKKKLQIDLRHIKKKYNNEFIENQEGFLKLHLGSRNKRYPDYINIDFRNLGVADYLCDITNIPLPSNSVELIETESLIDILPKIKLLKALKNWWSILIPGGILIFECKNNMELIRIIKRYFQQIGFKGIKILKTQGYNRLVQSRIRIEAYKSITTSFEIQKKPHKKEQKSRIEWRKSNVYLKWLLEFKEFTLKRQKILSLVSGTGELEEELRNDDHNVYSVDSPYSLDFEDNFFDFGYAFEVIEFVEPENLEKLFSEIKRVLKPNAKFFLIVQNKEDKHKSYQKQFFTKGTLSKLLDTFNLSINWINLAIGNNLDLKNGVLRVLISNKLAFEIKQNRRICAIGAYQIYGYSQLGFHWDGQKRAFKELGFETLFLDIEKDNNLESLRMKILDFKPDILWLGLKSCLLLIERMKRDLNRLNCIIIYWFCDLRGIEGIRTNIPLKMPIINPKKIGKHLDYIFISNVGQIEDFKKAFNIDNVFYMPQACTPIFHHNLHLKEDIDISFAGDIRNTIFHKERARLLELISKDYNILIRNNVRNNITEFYSLSKIVFGSNTPFLPFLYSSNRFFIAIGCGALYLCQYFPGMENLVENHKDVVWFKSGKELLDQIEYYLDRKEERDQIRRNAQKIAHSNHTYVQRIQNMIEIIDGKTNNFFEFS